MAVFARAELGQIGRKMVRNDFIGASLGFLDVCGAHFSGPLTAAAA
jgi:hypothetical protein